MTIKAGHKVQFADCAKHLKSYDKDAVGVVEYFNVGNSCCVKWTLSNGKTHKTTNINTKNLTRFRGTQYKEANRNEADSEGWIKWEGGECPVDNGTMVDIRLRDSETLTHISDTCEWDHIYAQDDIIAYRLHNPTDSDDNKETKQETEEMTTLHDWVHELGSINERAIELRELITKEVQKCGGSVEWDESPADTNSTKVTTWRDISAAHNVVFTGNVSDYINVGSRCIVTGIDIKNKMFTIEDKDGDDFEVNESFDGQWYSVTGDK